MVMLQRWSLMEGECYLTEVVSLVEGEWLCYSDGQFIGRRMVMLQKWPLMEGEWSCYTGGKFNGGRMVLLQRRPV